MDTEPTRFSLRCDEALFRSIAVTVVPEAETLSATDWLEFHRILEQALHARPARVQRQLSTFVRLVNVRALLRHAKPFQRLSRPERYTLLHGLERSRIGLLRRGMWGLRTLILMGFYARPAAAGALGYRANPAGWQAVRLDEAVP